MVTTVAKPVVLETISADVLVTDDTEPSGAVVTRTVDTRRVDEATRAEVSVVREVLGRVVVVSEPLEPAPPLPDEPVADDGGTTVALAEVNVSVSVAIVGVPSRVVGSVRVVVCSVVMVVLLLLSSVVSAEVGAAVGVPVKPVPRS